MREPLFDLSAEYEQMLNQGIRLSGGDRHFFLIGRVRYLMGILPMDFRPKRILDFGCGSNFVQALGARCRNANCWLGVVENRILRRRRAGERARRCAGKRARRCG